MEGSGQKLSYKVDDCVLKNNLAVLQELSKTKDVYEYLAEKWGGFKIGVPVSAHLKQVIVELTMEDAETFIFNDPNPWIDVNANRFLIIVISHSGNCANCADDKLQIQVVSLANPRDVLDFIKNPNYWCKTCKLMPLFEHLKTHDDEDYSDDDEDYSDDDDEDQKSFGATKTIFDVNVKLMNRKRPNSTLDANVPILEAKRQK
jgi:hypothetical protein